ncbi:unnamed protein product [Spirodela intermedia]|uniref:Pectinesterase n=1 Tax=Spirodela intermedia TaxID=51605 RepID=A0ABN7EAX4_SPIIN|nr:unnamed protein product [Spirodela intermedia]
MKKGTELLNFVIAFSPTWARGCLKPLFFSHSFFPSSCYRSRALRSHLWLRRTRAPSAMAPVTPDFCKSVLPPGRSGNLYDYGRFSVARSLSGRGNGLSLSQLAVRALEDCKLLSDLNIDFLSSTSEALNASNNLLDPQADRRRPLLSALLTNQQTCLDGLNLASSEWNLMNGLSVPLSKRHTALQPLPGALLPRLDPQQEEEIQLRPWLRPGGRVSVEEGTLAPHCRHWRGRPSPAGHVAPQPRDVRAGKWAGLLQSSSSNQILVRDAVMSAPNNTDATSGYHLIYIVAGVYQEYVEVPKNKKYLMMIGDGINRTIITGNRSVVDGWTTFNSATFGNGGAVKHQAVAVRNGADQSTFHRCSFEGYQDTLYTHSLRQFYRQCDIYGTVDFIFGNAAVVFQACNLYARLPLTGQKNMVTAQGRTDPNQKHGDLHSGVQDPCRPGSGEEWKRHEDLPWQAVAPLFPYHRHGEHRPRRRDGRQGEVAGFARHNATDALNFTVANFIDGDKWLPSTGVSYLSGLTLKALTSPLHRRHLPNFERDQLYPFIHGTLTEPINAI